ncbi:MAG: sigma-70 family RNA polymerase sigma factor [Planctomycetes bacterium]|nr:sigma-70 family RNA polymerase sigma factor [Planctomycetota bacterium]
MEPDPETLDRLRAGERDALAAVYAALADRVYRVTRNLLGQDADAEDATQEVFLKVFQHAASFAGRARFSTWVHRIAVHHCYWRLRQRRRRAGSQDAAVEVGTLPDPRDGSGPADARDLLDRMLGSLNAEQRAAVVLREVEGLSYQEIADILEVPIGTVMSRLNRARSLLAADAARRMAHERI